MTWEEREKKSRYPCGTHEWAWLGFECASWCCQQCLVFISCLMLEPKWLATAWFRGVIRLEDQWGHRQQVLVVFFLKYFVLEAVSRQWTAQKSSTGRAKALTFLAAKYRCASAVVSGDVCLGGCCDFSWCQSSFGVGASFGLLQCVSCFLSRNGWQAVKVGGGGPSVAQCPELASLRSVRCLRGSCAGMQEWGIGGISPRASCWVGDLSRVPLFLRRFGPSVWKWLCPHWRSGCSRWWLLRGDVVSMYLPLPLAGKILVNASQTCQDHYLIGRRYGLIKVAVLNCDWSWSLHMLSHFNSKCYHLTVWTSLYDTTWTQSQNKSACWGPSH